MAFRCSGWFQGRRGGRTSTPACDGENGMRAPAHPHVSAQPATLAARGPTLVHLQHALLWIFLLSSWFVVVEPAPYEFLFVLAFLAFLPGGLLASIYTAPMILFLIFYNIGGFLSSAQFTVLPPYVAEKANRFVFISSYMAVTSVFFAMAATARPERIAIIVRNAWVIAAVIATLTGIIGYFDIAGMGAKWAPIQRAQGTFKDPNVLSTYLVAPAVFLAQDFMLGGTRRLLLRGLALLVILGGIFLAFSRGGWADTVGSFMLLALFTFITTTRPGLRRRIVMAAALLVVIGALLLVILLSIPSVREIFLDRFTLLKSYDAGETGRFANQMRSIPLLLERPLGFGPFGFSNRFGEDPHNVYVNAFSAYGWLGGISYFMLVFSTLAVGLRAVLIPAPWRRHAIAFFAPLTLIIIQGFQIDTDHWRHFYLLLGMVWGLYAASELWLQGRRRAALQAAPSQ